METVTLDLQECFEEVKDRAFTSAAFSRAEWDEVVENVLNEKRATAPLSEDAWADVRDALCLRYEEFQGELAEM